jgi:hypothetical protein
MVFGQIATAPATEPINLYAVGGSWNQSASGITAQQYAATAMYARAQTAAGTYAFTAIDLVPTSMTPVTLTTQTSVGIAQRVLSVAGWNIYATAASGPSWTGTNTGWAWLAGGMASHAVGKGNWRVMPNVRAIKSSINNNSGVQLIIGVMVGFGQ